MDHLQNHTITVAGHLEEKRGIFQMCFTWKGESGKRERKSLSTGLAIEGNQKIAKQMLEQKRLEIEKQLEANGVKKLVVAKAKEIVRPVVEDNPFEVKGRLEKYRDVYQMRLSWKGIDGSIIRKSFSTGIMDKRGNKKLAEAMLEDKCQEIKLKLEQEAEEAAKLVDEKTAKANGDVLFADYLYDWLDYVRGEVAIGTYSGYELMTTSVIDPYFREKRIMLKEIKPLDVAAFYEAQIHWETSSLQGIFPVRFPSFLRRTTSAAFGITTYVTPAPRWVLKAHKYRVFSRFHDLRRVFFCGA